MTLEQFFAKLAEYSWKQILCFSTALVGWGLSEAYCANLSLYYRLAASGFIYLITLAITNFGESSFKSWRKQRDKDKAEKEEWERIESKLSSLTLNEKFLLWFFVVERKNSKTFQTRDFPEVREAIISLRDSKVIRTPHISRAESVVNISDKIATHLFKNENIVGIERRDADGKPVISNELRNLLTEVDQRFASIKGRPR